MCWLRQLPQAPAARDIFPLIERLRFVRRSRVAKPQWPLANLLPAIARRYEQVQVF